MDPVKLKEIQHMSGKLSKFYEHISAYIKEYEAANGRDEIWKNLFVSVKYATSMRSLLYKTILLVNGDQDGEYTDQSDEGSDGVVQEEV